MQILQKPKKETRKFTELPISVIRVSKNQTRTKFDEYELSLLCESIKQNGLLQPITVRHTQNGYELIAGERRLRACKQAGLKTIPAIIYELDSVSAALFTLIENLQRSDLSCFEEAEGIARLMKTCKMTQEEVDAVNARFHLEPSLEKAVKDVDCVIECIIEKEDVKRDFLT